MLMVVCKYGTLMPLSAGYVWIVNQLQQPMVMHCRHIHSRHPDVRHTSFNVKRPVGAFINLRFVTETVIAQTAAMSVVRVFAYC